MFIWKPWLSLLLLFFYFSFWPQAFIRLVQIHALLVQTPCWGYSACYLSLSFCLNVNALMNISWPLSTYHVSGLFHFSYCIERAALRSVSFWAFFSPSNFTWFSVLHPSHNHSWILWLAFLASVQENHLGEKKQRNTDSVDD